MLHQECPSKQRLYPLVTLRYGYLSELAVYQEIQETSEQPFASYWKERANRHSGGSRNPEA